ncbi:hypothetical protein PHYPO_G00101070 [Pangasianodon hypophthalmus]|uniref:Small integral membrane protein 26 n=1 Tax=Pangasianodon hypophthalmus TaxID=310915 RepID=A0A5N5PXU7_PANHP|nr:small integral membrane protein 26 [Pangasianodon hypophthalmus]KAB5583893.1 hypothetical protein PHYPO_G00101070 [Pangasianodon hypophthalmus]
MSFDGVKWYKRTALMYAIGTWTLLGSCVYYTFYKGDARVVIRKEEEDATPNVRLFKSSHMSAKITYKENFVPYSTRFLELFRPRADDSSGSQNEEK